MSDPNWSALQSVFDQALALPMSERESFLEKACRNDSELLDRVLALLAADGDDTKAGESLLDRALKSDDALSGTTIGPWRLIEPIGSGGMGSVFLAERADGAFEQRVAMKIIKKGMDSANVVQRFEQERQILARLDHPNIARLLDGGITDDGRPCIAMEYVDGLPITRYSDEQRLTIDERLVLFVSVCRAVHAAHRNLIVHRDLKPSNILVTATGEIKLLDFGIAKLLDDTGNPDMTKTGVSVHTPAYAAPEQITHGAVTTAIDIYALGGLLYELLSGRRPYDSRRATHEIQQEVTTVEPRKPSEVVIGATDEIETGNMSVSRAQLRTTRGERAERIGKVLSGDLDTICLMALHKDPDRRYASANQFAADIERYLDGLPVVARPDSVAYRTGKFVRRHRGMLAAGFAVVALFGVLVAHYTAQLADERDMALEEQRKANQVVQFVTGLFEVSNPAESKGETISARDLLDAGAARIRTRLAEQPEVQLKMQTVLGGVYYSLGEFEHSQALLDDALTRQRALLGDRHLDVAATKISLGLTVQALGSLDTAGQLFDEAFETRQAILGDSNLQVLDAISVRAYLQESAGDYTAAESLYVDALAMARRLERGDSIRIAKSMKELAGLYRIMDRMDEAEPLLRDAMAMQGRLFGGPDPDTDDTKRQLAGLLRETNRFEESKRLYLQVLESRTRMLGGEHIEVAHTWNSYSQLLSKMGDHEGAIEANAKFIGIVELAYDGPHPSLGAAYNNRAYMLREQAEYDAALRYFQLSIDMQDAIELPARHPNRSFPMFGMAGTFVLQERYEEAEALLYVVLDLRREAFGESHSLVSEVKFELGRALIGQDQLREAESLLLNAFEALKNARGIDDERTRKAARELVFLYDALGDVDSAELYRLPAVDLSAET